MLQKINTYRKLGITNILNVALYVLEKKIGRHQKRMPVTAFSEAVFFKGDSLPSKAFGDKATIQQQAENLLAGKLIFFSHQAVVTTAPPLWRCNLEGFEVSAAHQHWSTIPDFNPAVGDIKNVWEPSRFDWLLVFTRAYRHTEDTRYLQAMNFWLEDWCQQNPVNGGPNWKCGQEASIRLMQTLLATFLLNEHSQPQSILIEFVVAHCRRIAPTLRYAMAQDNNHGTSEAAALFIAGYWLTTVNASAKNPASKQEIRKYQKLGRKWLENRANKLIESDGSFSQQSVNYHRVMLDTFAITEFWRLQLGALPLSDRFYQRAKVATLWLQTMTHPNTGDAPNLGANDGARLFVLTETDYRDFRPAIQLASVLFFNKVAYQDGLWNDQLHWLNLALPEQVLPDRESRLFDQGGYCFLQSRTNDLSLFVRYPRFRFRPSHADALHLDLWWKGLNVVRDGGTFSYNTESRWLNYFPGTESHSTIQFDDRDQMPRISRFLFGNWLKSDFVESIRFEHTHQIWAAQYTDSFGATHKRAVRLEKNRVVVTDSVHGFKSKAVLRWRLCLGQWQIKANQVFLKGITLSITVDGKPANMQMIEGYESRYYNKMTSLPVLEVEVKTSSELQTVFVFS